MSVVARREERKNLVIEDAQILFRNFAGREGQFNREGDRNFCVLLDEEVAERMKDDGWNVKYLRAREEGDIPQPYIQVSVSFKNRPPKIVMVTSKGKTKLPEEMVEFIDWVDIETADLIINPYAWAVRENSGIKAYLDSLYVRIKESVLDRKYEDIPDIEWGGQPLQIESGDDQILEGEVIEDDDDSA